MSSATGLIGRKIGMTQIFNDDGERIAVTVIEAGPCKVLQVKSTETKDGYNALQLGFGTKKEKNTTKPQLGHFKKSESTPNAIVREIRTNEIPADTTGSELTVAIFEGTQKVDVVGTTKGKGFQGCMVRWNFGGQRASHGNSKTHRALGSLGRHMSINKGVPKGKRMPGHLGNERVTVQGLKVVKIDTDNNLLLVKGAVPGANGSYLVINKSIQEKARKDREAKVI